MKALELEIFCDEIHKEYLHQDHSHWMYIGILFVPLDLKAELISHLLSMRCIQHESWQWDESLCPYKCGFHERNDTEIHYSNIHKTSAKYKIGLRWLHDFLIEKNNKKDNGLVYFNVLGLNLTRMNLDLFGTNGSRDLTIYNRFFRTTLESGANYFFGKRTKKVIKTMYHDKGGQESHDYFPWHAGYKINREKNENLRIENEEIVFIDSNHKVYPNEDGGSRNEAQLIQFIDLILGSIYCCLHNPSNRKEKRGIGLAMSPLLWRMMNNPGNPNSSYNYFRKQQVFFFPKRRESSMDRYFQQLDLFENLASQKGFSSNFYYRRPILLCEENQKTLDRFFSAS